MFSDFHGFSHHEIQTRPKLVASPVAIRRDFARSPPRRPASRAAAEPLRPPESPAGPHNDATRQRGRRNEATRPMEAFRCLKNQNGHLETSVANGVLSLGFLSNQETIFVENCDVHSILL